MQSLLATRLIDRLLGPLGRASRFDLDSRHHLPGWPSGQTSSAPDAAALAEASVRSVDQHALPHFWPSSQSTVSASAKAGRHPFLRVVEGGRRR